ncbi:TPA: type II/IV secretion system ATPase subunit [archaeon]|nr:type II/IV secretion system ATPase subunit [Candidatus Naiadarchaeales archaeon SRR2090153.bin1042]
MVEACGYEVLREGDSTVIRFNWLGCPYAPSLEDDPETMARVVDAITQVKDVNRIIIAEAYEYEYDEAQTNLLAEIAQVLEILIKEENILANPSLTGAECSQYFPEHFKFVEDLLVNKIRKDPIEGYFTLLDELSDFEGKVAALQFPKMKECYVRFIKEVLFTIKKYLEQTQIIKKIIPILPRLRPGDRLVYGEIFSPTIRPNFTLTRYMLKPPPDSELLDSYTLLGDIEVEIYRIKDQTENYYHVVPPEFKLPEEAYMALGMARRIMLGYKPTTTAFTDQTRDYFQRVGADLIATVANEQGISLKHDQVLKLAQILTRYTTGLGIMEILLADPKIQDIYINAPIGEQQIRILHSDFEECTTNLLPTKEDAESMAARFRLESGRPLDEAEPVLDTSAITPEGRARVCVITRSLSPQGLAFAFRRHRSEPWTFPLFIDQKMMSPLAAGLIWFVIDGGRAILYAGPRSSGKTSMLSAYIVEIMRKYRIITVEDTLELPIDEYRKLGYNILSLKVQSVITKLESEIPADEGIRTALRLGDSCLIIGEVRSHEAKALYEAMRVGALSNVVAGTIHGDDPYGVWDRVVNDLGVPTTSFKATDLLVMPAPIRSADGLHRSRRVVTITEIGKKWLKDPLKENGFIELMKYNAKKDALEPTKDFLDGNSEVLMGIGSKVKEWAGDWHAIMDNIKLRADIKQAIVDLSNQSKNKEILEARFVGRATDAFHLISDKVTRETGGFDSKEIYNKWMDWAKSEIRGKPVAH